MAISLSTTADWDRPIRQPRSNNREAGSLVPAAPPTVDEAIEAWLRWRGYARSTERRIREHLKSTRARGWREHRGIETIQQFTAAEAAEYLIYMRERGAEPATLRKLKTLLLGLADFCATTPGYQGLEGEELRRLKLPPLVERIPEALTEEECVRLLAACGTSRRDRLIVETLLLTGMRLSELCALTIEAVDLESRPAFVVVHGTVYNRRSPKSSRERRIIIDYDVHGFGRGFVTRLRHYIRSERPTSGRREIFLSQHHDSETGEHPPLTTVGVQKLMNRLEAASGIHCNPHRLRHTFATRCADNDVSLFQLQEALGHASLDMVRRYYTQSKKAMARAFYRAFGADETLSATG